MITNETYNKVINFLEEYSIDTEYYQTEDSREENYTWKELDKLSAKELILHIDVEKLIKEENVA